MIAMRSALAVHLQADGKVVPNLRRELKLARAATPPKLRKELDKLAKESGVQGGRQRTRTSPRQQA
eukprot:712579-Pyramimonas_sp.AAC.1